MSANLVEDTQCSPDKKPADTQVCYNVPCGSRWFAEDWTQVKCKRKKLLLRVFYKERLFSKFCKIQRKTLVSEPLS